MIDNLNLKNRIKNNWYSIIITIAFLITLLNYIELKNENENLNNQTSEYKNDIERAQNENDEFKSENESLESLESENEELKEFSSENE